MSLVETIRTTAALPQEKAITLPGSAYTDVELFEYECHSALQSGWHCLGRCDEVPEPGDYFTTDLLGEPLLIVRGDDGVIRVLSNLCRHRAMPLAEGKGSAEKFVCSYHAWSYARDGALRSAARMKNTALDTKACRLPEFRTEEWRGFLYVSLDDAPDLAPSLEGLEPVVGPYHTAEFSVAHTAEEVWECNWKCLVENFM